MSCDAECPLPHRTSTPVNGLFMSKAPVHFLINMTSVVTPDGLCLRNISRWSAALCPTDADSDTKSFVRSHFLQYCVYACGTLLSPSAPTTSPPEATCRKLEVRTTCPEPEYYVHTWLLALVALGGFLRLELEMKTLMTAGLTVLYVLMVLGAFADVFLIAEM